MEHTLTNISELKNTLQIEKVQVLSFTENLEKINKIKFGLSFGYFLGVVIFTSMLFL